MTECFKWGNFSDLNLEDEFFDSLKSDYSEFEIWFRKKQKQKQKVLFCKNNEDEVVAMLYLKEEKEKIILDNIEIPLEDRLKIGTFKLSSKIRSKRIGEGLIGLALWRWQDSEVNQIYVTVYEKQKILISLFVRFGFEVIGSKSNGELVFMKDKRNLSYDSPYKSFPYVNPNTKNFGMIPIFDYYHDSLFPLSQLKRNSLDVESIIAGNGITKTFLGFPRNPLAFSEGDIVFLYRICVNGNKKYESVISSYCSVAKIENVSKRNCFSFEDFLCKVKNRTAFTETELKKIYETKNNIVAIDLLYNGFFGAGNNVNYDYLKTNNLFNDHPYNIIYSREDFEKILKKGKVNVQNVIIN